MGVTISSLPGAYPGWWGLFSLKTFVIFELILFIDSHHIYILGLHNDYYRTLFPLNLR